MPISPSLGLIEWVRKTQTLRKFLETISRDVFKSPDLLEDAKQLKWKEVTDRRKRNYDEERLATMPVDKTLDIQQRCCDVLPWNLLRRGLESLARSPEAFVFLQMAWTKCLASLSVATYILGIGDRHLGNILLNTETGRLLNIDFGYSFGIQIQSISIPELVPFRLSRQLQNVFLPFQVSSERPSPLAYKMAACLNAWRNNASTIAAVGEVFVIDPSADWESYARRVLASKRIPTKRDVGKNGEGDDDEEKIDDNDNDNPSSIKFYPRKKLATLKRKLKGVHPVAILKDEIAGRTNESFIDKWTKIAEVSRSVKVKDMKRMDGDASGGNVTANDSEPTLTVNDQVNVLIDLATDPNILGRAWVGWEPHV